MPIATIARQSGRLYTKHGTDLTFTNHRHQALESGTLNESGTGPPQIVVNDFDLAEAEALRVVN
jgi:hypothetical protein